MTCQSNNIEITEAMEQIITEGLSGLPKALEILMNAAMQIERNRHLQAAPYERTGSRQGYANGFKDKTIRSRIGKLKLSVPQVRDCDFYPSSLEKGLRSERALKLVLAEMYVQGVSTRKVQNIVGELCGWEVSSTEVSRCSQLLDEELSAWRARKLGCYPYLFLDARYEKVRQGNQVLDAAVLIAAGIDRHGKREILGVSVKLSEHEVHWRSFLEDLQQRGLHGVRLLTSDAHAGLKLARKAVFPSIPWQRCQFHLQQNAQSYVPKLNMRSEVASDIRSIFNAANEHEATRLLKIYVEKYAENAPQLSQWLEENVEESLTIFSFPESHRKRLRTSNILERVNRELKKRTRIASIFPNPESCERLITALLLEMSDEWQSSYVYLDMQPLLS